MPKDLEILQKRYSSKDIWLIPITPKGNTFRTKSSQFPLENFLKLKKNTPQNNLNKNHCYKTSSFDYKKFDHKNRVKLKDVSHLQNNRQIALVSKARIDGIEEIYTGTGQRQGDSLSALIVNPLMDTIIKALSKAMGCEAKK